MMVEENGDFNVAATSDTQRMYGLQAVSDCHCLELGIKDVFEAFEGNRDVLRLLTRCKCPEQRNTHSRASASASQQGRCARCAARMLANAHPGGAPRNRAHTTPFPPTPPFPSICVFFLARSSANLLCVLRYLGVRRKGDRESEREGKGRGVWLYRPCTKIIYKLL